MTPIIEVEGLGKRYRIGESVPHRTLREGLVSAVGAPFRKVREAMRRDGSETGRGKPQIWALREVSFEVMPGEVLGVIGRNGAGKSTLLKVLSRITEPTEGRAQLRGRVGSLLEVGTGFHPELSGRENIYLSGAILGMRHGEVARKFDEIVDFAGVERFVDTPIKHFSSGMYMRLAFAVAAHLETEILLIDEVLAVGDAAFQKQCLGKMGDVARQGRTVLFVSHNMASIEGLCDQCILFSQGRLVTSGRPADVIQKYLVGEMAPKTGPVALASHPGRRPGSRPLMTAATVCGREPGIVRMGEELSVAVTFVSEPEPIRPVLGLVVRTSLGAPVFGVNNKFINGYRFDRALRKGIITCTLDSVPLMHGTYSIDLYFGDDSQDYDTIEYAVTFEVVPADIYGSGKLPSAKCGPIFTSAEFSLKSGIDSDATTALQLSRAE